MTDKDIEKHRPNRAVNHQADQNTDEFPFRLRGAPGGNLLHVVLVEPEIPPNTGNIARLCAATRCHLHLIHPLGFRVDEKSVRRAGLDYWHLVEVSEYPSFRAFEESLSTDVRCFFFTGKSERSYLDVEYRTGDMLIFGKESAGLDPAIIEAFKEKLVGIPTLGEVRSLNLANSVALGVYEALRQLGALDQAELRSK